jgi:hypothetical protein
MILVSDDTVLFGTTSNTIFVVVRYAFAILLFFELFYKYVKNKVNSRGLPYLLIMISLVLFTGLYFGDIRSGYFYKIILLAVGFFFAKTTSLDSFIKDFISVVYFIAVCALAGWVLMAVLPGFVTMFPVVSNVSDVSFYNLFLTNVPLAVHGTRLFGIFREPGVGQMYFNLALAFLIATSERSINYKFFVVFIISVVLTQSTTGYISLAFILLFFMLKPGVGRKYIKEKFFISVLIIAALFIVSTNTSLLSSEGDVLGKLGDTQRSSTVARLASLYCNIEIFKQYPLFGAGFDNMGTLFPALSGRMLGVEVEQNTNMLLIQFATHGLLYGLLWVYGCLKLFYRLCDSWLPFISLAAAFLCLCIGEDLTWSFLFYIILFYGVTSPSKKKTSNYVASVV